MSRADKMYKDSPELQRNEESGKMAVVKKASKEKESSDEKGENDGIPAPARHQMERMELHSKHQHEHHAHDSGKHGSKSEMHARHVKEYQDMFKRHEKELGEK